MMSCRGVKHLREAHEDGRRQNLRVCESIDQRTERRPAAAGLTGVWRTRGELLSEAWRNQEISSRVAAKQLGISHMTFQKWVRENLGARGI